MIKEFSDSVWNLSLTLGWSIFFWTFGHGWMAESMPDDDNIYVIRPSKANRLLRITAGQLECVKILLTIILIDFQTNVRQVNNRWMSINDLVHFKQYNIYCENLYSKSTKWNWMTFIEVAHVADNILYL